jgi:hypothetical protein
MPLPPLGVTTPSEVRPLGAPPKKRKRPEASDPIAEASADLNQKIAAGQAASYNSLHSDIVYGIALAATHDREAARATSILARSGDLKFPSAHTVVLPDPETGEMTPTTMKEFLDPLTNQPILLRRARAWFQDAALTQAIVPGLMYMEKKGVKTTDIPGGVTTPSEVGGQVSLQHGRKRVKLDPYQVAAYVEALEPLPGRIPFATALSAATHLAVDGVDIGRFRQALSVMVDWNGRTDLLSESQMIGMAQYWASNEDRRLRVEDVGPMYDPELQRALAIPGTPGEYPSGPGGEGSRPLGIQIVAAETLTAASMAARSAEAYERYDEQIHIAVEGALSEDESFIARGFTAAFSWYDRQVLERIMGAWWAGGGLIMQDPEMYNQGRELILHGGDRSTHRTVGDYVAEAQGLQRGTTAYSIVSGGSEFMLTWFMDPLILAGKFSHGWQLGQVALTGTERSVETLGLAGRAGYLARTGGKDVATRFEEWLTSFASSRRVAGLGERGLENIPYPTSMPIELVESADDVYSRSLARSRAPEVVPEEALPTPGAAVEVGPRPGRLQEWKNWQDATVEQLPKQGSIANRDVGTALEHSMDIGREIAVQGPKFAAEGGYVAEKIRKLRTMLQYHEIRPAALLEGADQTKLAEIVAAFDAYTGPTNPLLDEVADLVKAVAAGDESVVGTTLTRIENLLKPSEAAGITSSLTVAGEEAAQDAFAAQLEAKTRAMAAKLDRDTEQLVKDAFEGGDRELVADITEHGITEPLVIGIDRESGRYFLADGARRLRAARELGHTDVPVIVTEVAPELAQRNTLPLMDIRTPKMTEAEYVYRASLQNPEQAAISYKGAFNSPGLDPQVTAFIQKWGREAYGGKVTFQAIEDTKDILRIAIGARPTTTIGYRFKQMMDAGGLRVVESRINGLVRKTIGTAMDANEGILTPSVRQQIVVNLSRGLRSMGVDKSVSASILANVRGMEDETLRIIATASKRDLRAALGLEAAIVKDSAVNVAQFGRSSDVLRGHLVDLGERRTSIVGLLTREGQSEKGLIRRIKQFLTPREYQDWGKQMVAEFQENTAETADQFVQRFADTAVQYQRGGGLIADLVSDAGLTSTKGNLVATMGELRDILGDELTDLITQGVSTQAQLRTRLRQVIAGPGAAATGDILTGARSVGIATYADQLADLAGLQRIYPSSAGFTQVAHEIRLNIKDSAFWKSRAMSWIGAKTPPSLLNVEGFNAAQQWGRWLKGMKVKPAEVDAAVSEFRLLAASKSGLRERQLATYFQGWIEKAYKAHGGIPEDEIVKIMNVVRPHHNFISRAINNREKIARAAGMPPMVDPPLETMLKNVWALPSPKEMEISIRRAFGRFGGVERDAQQQFGKAVADLSTQEFDQLIGSITWRRPVGRALERGSIFADHARNTWVAWQLLRPGWALKVLPDENFRALVMLHDFFDRVSAVSGYAKMFDKLGVQGREVAVNLMNGTQRTIELQLPGLLPFEPMASQGLMHGSRLRSLASRQADLARAITDAAEFLTPASREFYSTWSHMLNRRIVGSELGSWILKTLARDTADGRMWTWERVIENANANPRIWQALRQPGEDIGDVVARARSYVEQAVTVDGRINVPLIQEAMYGNLTPNALKKMFRDMNDAALPKLPSLELAEAVGQNAPMLGNARDTLTDWLMRRPSDWLNRNPLFKAEYSREVERLLTTQTAAGRQFSQVELRQIHAGTHPLALQARGYALDRELGTMFTYINNSQFSEAARHIFPFVSPYQEQFQVWGRLLWQNPQIAEQTRLMLKLATDTGVVHKDEMSGEWVINSKALTVGLSALLLLHPYALAATAVAFGLGPAEEALGLPKTDWMVPVKNLNLFLANTFSIGDIPIPVPGLSPPAEFLFNKVAEHTGDFPGKANIVNYMSAYGTDFSVLPASWHRALTAAFGDKGFDPELFESTKNHMTDAMLLQGFQLVDDQGQEIPGAAEELDRIATLHAREFLMVRALNQFVQPTSPMPVTESNQIRDEMFDLVDEHGFKKAVKMMQEKYPDSPNITMLAIGYSLWNQPGPSIPPTTEATAILNAPGIAEAARRYPEMAFFLIPSEFRNGTYDFEAARQQLDEALRTVNPAVVVSQSRALGGLEYGPGASGGRAFEYLRTQGWEQFFTIESTFKAKLKANGDPKEGTGPYDALRETWFDRPVNTLQKNNYAWAADYGQHDEPFLDEALAKLRVVSDTPIWRDTEMGKALREYFAVTDPMRQIMYDHNISSLDTASAEERGLDKQYKDLVAGLEERYPDVWPYLDKYWLGKDFQAVNVRRDTVLAKVGADETWISETFDPWTDKRKAVSNRINNAQTQTELSAAYLDLNRLSIRAEHLSTGPGGLNPEDIWWQTMTEHEQNDTRMRVAQKPYVFLTSFERHTILGIKSPPRIEDAFIRIAEAKVAVNEAIDGGADTGDTWGQFDKWVKDEIMPIPGMPKAIRQAHRPGYTLFQNIPKEWMQGSEGDAWKAIRAGAVNTLEAFRDAEFVDDSEFRQVRVAFGEYIHEWSKYSPDFKDHVNYLQSISQDQLGDILMPELWWTLI